MIGDSIVREAGTTILVREAIYYVYGINGIEKSPRAVSPSEPIEQANGSCRRTYYPSPLRPRLWSTCMQRAASVALSLSPPFTPSQISFRAEDVAGRINPRDFRRNFLAAGPEDASSTAPEVDTRRLTRGNGPRERSVPKFFPSILH